MGCVLKKLKSRGPPEILPDITDSFISNTCPDCGCDAIAYTKTRPYIRFCKNKHKWKRHSSSDYIIR